MVSPSPIMNFVLIGQKIRKRCKVKRVAVSLDYSVTCIVEEGIIFVLSNTKMFTTDNISSQNRGNINCNLLCNKSGVVIVMTRFSFVINSKNVSLQTQNHLLWT